MSEEKVYKIEDTKFNKNATPFKEIIKGEEINDFGLELSEDKKISLKDTFRLKINVK